MRSRCSKLVAWPPARASRGLARSSRQPAGPRREGRSRAAGSVTWAPPSRRGRGRGWPRKAALASPEARRPSAETARLPAASSSTGSEERAGRATAGRLELPPHPRRRGRASKTHFLRGRAHFRPAFPGVPGPRALAFSVFSVLVAHFKVSFSFLPKNI